jgi:2-polyprenyl-3-methyl-5-hydroxy-6-metoxy-1,4-benzoquinol methylase
VKNVSDSSQSRYTDGTYLAANRSWHSDDAPWKAREILRLLSDHQLSPQTVCDVGCGTGDLLAVLQRHMPPSLRLAGYDVAPDLAPHWREKQNAKLNFHLADFLSERDAHCDLLLLIDVFEHIEDYLGFLRSLSSRARHFVFHIPLDLHVSSIMRAEPLLAARAHVGHLHYFLRETALATLVDAGYKIINERYTAGALLAPRRSLRTRIAAFPRTILHRHAPHVAARWLGGFSLLVLAEAADSKR